MTLVQNFPFFCIILSMFSAIISFVLNGKWAKIVHVVMVTAVFVMSLFTLQFTYLNSTSYTYMMGHYPAPWGNEIRIGELECLMAASFSLIMLLSVMGGAYHIKKDIEAKKLNLFFIQLDLMMASLLALIYTNDLFTAYVFIEICTISACGIIMARKIGRVYVSAIKYMVMSLIGSGLFLIGLSLLYAITGQLLMSPAKEAMKGVLQEGIYLVPAAVIMVLLTVGLGIKSGLYPFHTWIPDAYGYSTPAASAILSSLVSKGYIFLLIKLIVRVLPYDSVPGRQMENVLFFFGIIGMIIGSVDAIRDKNIRRMISYSSVAQIGYIYMGIGLGSSEGIIAALFHVISHGVMKSLLFISATGLIDSSGNRLDRSGIVGAGYRNRIAGIGFTIGSLSMIGMPLCTGFVSKFMFASAATQAPVYKMIIAWTALAISTVLNAVYFMRTVLVIYTPQGVIKPKNKRKTEADTKTGVTENYETVKDTDIKLENIAIIALSVLILILGTLSPMVITVLTRGLTVFG
ncbi:MAG: sodium:proton antiporter [Butyrivibrio sp.]|nr:sodium:proton antiporter [Butyrivibrio sp.]